MSIPNLIQRIIRTLPAVYAAARTWIEQELNQLVAQANALRDALLSLETASTANLTLINEHVADDAKHGKYGLRSYRVELGSSTNTQIDVYVDAISTDDGAHVMMAEHTTGGKTTLDITTYQAVGGLDYAGPVTADAWHYLYEVFDPDEELAGTIGSLSATAPTLPAGYTAKALIGWFYVNDSSWIEPFAHEPSSGIFRIFTRHTAYATVYETTIDGAAGTWKTFTLNVPDGCRTVGGLFYAASAVSVYMRPPGSSVVASTVNQVMSSTSGSLAEFETTVGLDDLKQVDLQRGSAVACYFDLNILYFGG